MAIIKNKYGSWYIHVVDESTAKDVDVSSHSVENGIDISDTVKRKAATLSLSGSIVDFPLTFPNEKPNIKRRYWVKAADVISAIELAKNKGVPVSYQGRNVFYNMLITSFSTSHPNTIMGGCEFSMELKEVRIAKNSYVAPKDDEVKDGGTQQVDKGEREEVWYTVKKGDCVSALVAEPYAPYKNLKREGAASGYWGACNWVMDKNQSAFSRKGDFRTLQIGKKIILGTR